jgi:Glycine zipper
MQSQKARDALHAGALEGGIMSIRTLTAIAVLASLGCGRGGDQRDVGLERTARRDVRPPDTTSTAPNQVTPAAPESAALAKPESTPKPTHKAKPKATAPKSAAEKSAAAKAADTTAIPPGTPSATEVAAVVSKLGLAVYPAKGQTKEQQARDERACYAWAHSQTGIDPMAVAVNRDSAVNAGKAAAESTTPGAGARGAARGAAGGAAVGAIAGDAGKGAAIGGVAGAAAGRKARKQAEQQAEQQAGQQAQAEAAQMSATFTKAMAACLEGKGYTAK